MKHSDACDLLDEYETLIEEQVKFNLVLDGKLSSYYYDYDKSIFDKLESVRNKIIVLKTRLAALIATEY